MKEKGIKVYFEEGGGGGGGGGGGRLRASIFSLSLSLSLFSLPPCHPDGYQSYTLFIPDLRFTEVSACGLRYFVSPSLITSNSTPHYSRAPFLTLFFLLASLLHLPGVLQTTKAFVVHILSLPAFLKRQFTYLHRLLLDASLLSHGDLSNLSTDFFRNVPGLEAPPVDPAAVLQIPMIAMPAWSHMPMHLTAEEQAEVDEDPFADYNVNDAYVVDYDGDSNDPLSAEEDQLADSPGPVHESPIPQPSRRRKRALSPQGSIQPLRYPPPTAEEQIGGGYPRREATPPINPPATRLRTNLIPTRRQLKTPKPINGGVRRTFGGLRATSRTFGGFALPPDPSAGVAPSFTNTLSFSLPPAGPSGEPLSFPPPEPPSTPPQRPRPRPAHGKARIEAWEALCNKLVVREDKPTSHRAMSDEPGTRPVAQARAETTPTSKPRAPSAEYQPPPPRYQPPPPPPPPHSAFYQPISLPPPPAGYSPGIHRLMPPGPRPLTPVVEDLELGELPIPSPAASDYNEDALKDIRGRPTTEQAARLLQFVQVELGVGMGGTRTRVSREASSMRWQSINGYSPALILTPWNSPSSPTRMMYKKFQEAYSEGEAELILEKYAELMLLEGEETLASRQRQFDRICNGLRGSIDIANEKDFEAIVLIVGASIHEDTELAQVIATPSLETAFAKSLKNSTTGRPLRNDHLLGVAKLCAYAGQLERSMGSMLMLPEALEALEALETTIMPHAEKLAKAVAVTTAAAKASAELTKAETATAAVAKAFAELKKGSAVVAKASAPVAKVKKTSPAMLHPALHHRSHRRPSTITPTAGPSTIAPTVGPSIADPVVIKNTTPNLNAMRDRFCDMSQACIGFDLFRDKGAQLGGNFLWVPLAATLAANNLRLLGYPTNTRLPSQGSSDKGSGAWRAQELTWFNVALAEHESKSGWGFRLEHHPYSKGDLVIIGHDYTFATPQDPSANKEFWQTSRGKPVYCQDVEGNVWSACIDVRRAGDAAITKTFIRAKAKKSKKKAAVKVEEGYDDDDDNDDDGDEEDGETEEEVISSKAKGKSKAVEGRSKVAKVPEVRTKSVAAKKTTAVAARKTTAQPKKMTSAKQKAPSADSSDFYEDDVPEEEEATSPPPPMKKLRSAGPISPMPPPPPRTLQQPVQYMESAPVPAGKPGGMFKMVMKQVSFTPPRAPANHPAVVAERRRRIHAIKPVEQDDGPSGSHTAASREIANAARRNFLLPQNPAAAPRPREPRAQRPKPAATPSAPQLPAQPANVAQMASQMPGSWRRCLPSSSPHFLICSNPRNSIHTAVYFSTNNCFLRYDDTREGGEGPRRVFPDGEGWRMNEGYEGRCRVNGGFTHTRKPPKRPLRACRRNRESGMDGAAGPRMRPSGPYQMAEEGDEVLVGGRQVNGHQHCPYWNTYGSGWVPGAQLRYASSEENIPAVIRYGENGLIEDSLLQRWSGRFLREQSQQMNPQRQ
ncbi:hypothetical protein B0H13DRAFT_1883022 [Mycena leptocephala]|nr:hypothetical protein B0H13DRAFT_1883022 [Mycena leptocephala]